MIIFVVRTFRGYWVTASEEEAEFKANKLYDELEQDYGENRVRKLDVWTRIDIYESECYEGAPFKYLNSRWANKM